MRSGPLALGAAAVATGLLAASSGTSPRAAPVPLLQSGASAAEVIRANNHGTALMEQFKHAQALSIFAGVTEKAPGWAPGFVNLGLAALYAHELGRAEAAFREAIRLDPGRVQAHCGLGLLLKNEGKTAEAIAAFEKARALDPADPDTLYNLGLLEARRRDFGDAVSLLKQARQIDPNSMSIRYQLAQALLRSGQEAAGRTEMAAYKKLAANPAFAVPTGSQYGEAGRYALVITDYADLAGPPAAAPSAPVRFRDATASSGIRFVHGGPGGEAGQAMESGGGEDGARAAARYGSGVAVGDLDGDGRPDLVFANASADGKARPALYRNLGDFRFEDITARSGVSFEGIGMAAALGDFDNDNDLDLFLGGLGHGALFANQGNGVFKEVTGRAGIRLGGFLMGVSWADVDHDGDLDLLVCRLPAPGSPAKSASGAILLLNRGDGTFIERTAELHMTGPATGALGAVFSDFDGDRDIDAVLSAAGGQDALLDNRREAGFVDRGLEVGLAARGAGRGVSAGDVNGDGLADLVFATGPREPLRLYLNNQGRRFTLKEIPKPQEVSAYGTVLFDADNDGDLDLFVTGSRPLLYLNDGAGNFTDATKDSGLGEMQMKDGRAVAAADLDGDGDLDLVLTRNGGPPMLLRNEGGNGNHWLQIEARGLNSNHDGVGTKVEVQAGAHWQRREVQAGSGYLSQSPGPIQFGLGDSAAADFVRLLWPGGVLQAEMDVPGGQRVEETELDRKGSSCPLLFAWNGSRYGFVTDFLGMGGLGMWMAPGVYGRPDPDEYVKIEAGQLAPRDGAYVLQLLENLEEVAYLDEARLVTIDHPKGIAVYPNERFGGPERREHRLYAIEEAGRILPARATDGSGRDVTERLLRIDRAYPDEFRLSRLAGYAEMHTLTLEFPVSVVGQEGLVLFLYGWVDFEYSSSNYAAYQSGVTLTAPVLEMEGEDGLFHPRIDSMGFPPGLPRMMAVDLGDAPLTGRKIRIRTNMRVYWDQIFLARPLTNGEMAAKIQINEVALSGAHLHRRGFPREHSPDGREPRLYDYGILDNTQPFKSMPGDYTRFGRVTELLTRADDRFVVFGKGEEVTLEFPTKGLPRLPLGSVRSFLLHTDGYCKDMDPHTAYPDSVEPLPFHAMSAYPYPDSESFPDDADHREYRKTYNTRRVEAR